MDKRFLGGLVLLALLLSVGFSADFMFETMASATADGELCSNGAAATDSMNQSVTAPAWNFSVTNITFIQSASHAAAAYRVTVYNWTNGAPPIASVVIAAPGVNKQVEAIFSNVTFYSGEKYNITLHPTTAALICAKSKNSGNPYAGGYPQRYPNFEWASAFGYDFYMRFSGTNSTTPDVESPQVNISYPSNGSWINLRNNNLSVYSRDDIAMSNLTVTLDICSNWDCASNFTKTISSPTNNTNTTFNMSRFSNNTWVFDAYYFWWASGCDTSNNCTTTDRYVLRNDATYPIFTNVNTTSTPSEYVQVGAPISFNATITDANLSAVWLQLSNGTNYTFAVSGTNYSLSFSSLPAGQYNYTWWANDTAFNSNHSATYPLTSYTVYLGACGTTSNTTALNMSFFYEEDWSKINQTLEWNGTITAFGMNFYTNGSQTGQYVPICIYPSFGLNYNVTMMFNYFNDTFVTRQYYLYQAALVTATSNLSLYNLKTGEETNVTVAVTDSNGLPANDVYVSFQRYYVPTNAYKTVAMMLTSGLGDGVVHLRCDDVWYRVTGTQYGQVVFSYYPVQIDCDDPSLSLSTSASAYGTYWLYYSSVAANCDVNLTSEVVTCGVTDTTGMATSSRMIVAELGALTNTSVCDSTSGGTAATTFTCALGNTTDKNYVYGVSAVIGGNTYILKSGSFSGNRTNEYGSVGYILAVFIIISVGIAGLFNPAAFVVMTVLGIVAASYFGFFPFGLGALIAIGLVGGIIMVAIKT